MTAADTNILIYAHRIESEWHEAAAARLVALSEGVERWALPVFCVTEIMRVVTHRRVFNPPSTVAQAADFIEAVVASPSCEVVRPGAEFMAPLLRGRPASSPAGQGSRPRGGDGP